MDFSKLLYGFVKIDAWISLSCYTDFSKVVHGFLKLLHGLVKFLTLICLSCYMDLSKLFYVSKFKFKLLHGFVKVVLCIQVRSLPCFVNPSVSPLFLCSFYEVVMLRHCCCYANVTLLLCDCLLVENQTKIAPDTCQSW